MLNRLIFLLSLIGIIVTLHLWIQKERNFDRGCWGFGAATAAGSTEGCRAPALERASSFAGIPTTAWGHAFYSALGLLTLARVFLPTRPARLCHYAAELLAVSAVPPTIYLLIVQAFIAKAFCPLCLVCAGITLSLFTLHAVQWRRGGVEPPTAAERGPEIAYAFVSGTGALLALGALLFFVDRVGLSESDGPRATPKQPNAARRIQPPLKVADWVDATTPSLGAAAGISVVTFLDPNCPHCGQTFSTLTSLSNRFRDRATFYILPAMLWDYSVPQVQALEVARQRGKYFEMWRLQLDRQKRGGLKEAELEELFRDLNMDTTGLTAQLAATRPRVQELRKKTEAVGINSTPLIFIDGVAVEGTGKGWDDLAKAIESAAARR